MALKRELQEELGVEVYVSEQVGECLLDIDKSYRITLFHVVEVAKCPELREQKASHIELLWADLNYAVRKLPCTPSTYAFYRDVVRFMKKRTVENMERDVAR